MKVLYALQTDIKGRGSVLDKAHSFNLLNSRPILEDFKI